MVRSLQELALLNMRVKSIISPNLEFDRYPSNCHIIPEIIFNVGKNLFIEELQDRDESIGDLWRNVNGHFCLINEQNQGDACWCACNPERRICICNCFHIFHMLLDRIYEEHGALNYNARLKFVLARPRFWSRQRCSQGVSHDRKKTRCFKIKF